VSHTRDFKSGCPWAFGIEDTVASLNNYSLQPAWQLDYVFQLAEQRGIYLLLCLDYHGMFATEPDCWGGNNVWPQNPYNITNGGPCTTANDFFTNATAIKIYPKACAISSPATVIVKICLRGNISTRLTTITPI
jgi:hypothetical protein